MIYVTSDTHFFDKKMLGLTDFAKRPFFLTEMMNEEIIANWNEVVAKTDTVYHLGDIAVHRARPEKKAYQDIYELLNRLHGRLVLIKGNHDNRALFKYLAKHNYEVFGRPKFNFEDVGVLLKHDHRQYYLTHYPMRLDRTENIVNLHGHIHHHVINAKENLNVGIDSVEMDYLPEKPSFGQPLSLSQIEVMLQAKKDDYLKRR